MGDVNQYRWVERQSARLRAPVLEIGSRHYARETSSDFRSLCAAHQYLGVDMSAGDNVDRVVDFTKAFADVDRALGGGRFGTILCLSVMEHVSDIVTFANNLTAVTAPGGILFLSVPFSWRFHGYPSDYFRFTPEGVKQLFPRFDFNDAAGMLSSNVVGDTALFSADVNAFMVQKPSRSLWSRISGKRTSYLLKPTMISMLGTRRAD